MTECAARPGSCAEPPGEFHAFEMAGTNYLFFPRSAALYQLSGAASRLLTDLQGDAPHSPTLPSGEPQLLELLEKLLQNESEVAPPVAGIGHPREEEYQAFSLYLTQTCNMSCRYCWNGGGSFGWSPSIMGADAAERAIEQIVALARQSTAPTILIHLYGGEPLLNFAALQQITLGLRGQEKLLSKSFSFTLDTNGSLLEGERAEFLARHFTRVGISVDGREEIHDLLRRGGDCTWQRIVSNLRRFPRRDLLLLRGTLTVSSDSYLETFRQLTKLGVRNIQLEYCHEPWQGEGRHPTPLSVPLERQVRELREFIDYYVKILTRCQDTEQIPFLSNLMDTVRRLRRGTRHTRPCGAGVSLLALNCAAEIYPCIAFVERDAFAMGRAGAGTAVPLRRTLPGFDVDENLSCRGCWMRYDCSGGCYATHYRMTGSADTPHPEYCRAMRAKGEVYLYALAQMLNHCPWHL